MFAPLNSEDEHTCLKLIRSFLIKPYKTICYTHYLYTTNTKKIIT